jgi:hypothetical protein
MLFPLIVTVIDVVSSKTAGVTVEVTVCCCAKQLILIKKRKESIFIFIAKIFFNKKRGATKTPLFEI